jgi:replicative DNA helicase
LTSMDFERKLPPQSIESEMSLLGAVFVSGSALDTIHAVMPVDDLYRESHRKILLAMTALADKGEPVDLITLTNGLRSRGELEEVGGGAYLYTLSDYVPMAENVAHYCRIVSEKARERRVIIACNEAADMAYKGGRLDEAVARLETAIEPSLDKQGEPVQISATLRDVIKRIETRYENKGVMTGISYGLDELDRVTLGMHRGDLVIVAGRPSMGKTAFVLNTLKAVCCEGHAGMMFSLEMSRMDNVDRMLASYNAAYQRIRSGRLEENDWPKLTKAAGLMHDWTFPIDDTPGISLRDLRAKARRQKKNGLDVLAVDYMQLMRLSDPKMNRVQGLGEISRGLKLLARELDITVLALSQLNRSVDSRQDKRPTMSDLRDSGEIEQDADVILFPYRPAAYCDKCRDKVDDGDHDLRAHQAKAEIIIEKQRAGERNLSIPVCWLGEYQRFESVYDPDRCPY